MDKPSLFFQYCPKFVLFSKNWDSIFLAKRKGEADYDGTFTFIGGKTPVIPHIPWPNNGDGTVWDNGVKAFNSKIDQLIASNPNIIKGPDMYKVLQDHPNWFQAVGNVHPNEQGSLAFRCAWAYAIAENVYKTTPAPITACNGFASP